VRRELAAWRAEERPIRRNSVLELRTVDGVLRLYRPSRSRRDQQRWGEASRARFDPETTPGWRHQNMYQKFPTEKTVSFSPPQALSEAPAGGDEKFAFQPNVYPHTHGTVKKMSSAARRAFNPHTHGTVKRS
jgi:hypothetical protein